MIYRIPHYFGDFHCLLKGCGDEACASRLMSLDANSPYKDYPGKRRDYPGTREGYLSLACIEAAKFVLGYPEPVRFPAFQDDSVNEQEDEAGYKDRKLLFEKLSSARDAIIAILQRRDMDIMVRAGAAVDLAERVGQAVEEDRISGIDAILEDEESNELFFSLLRKPDYRIGEHEFCANMRKMFRTFFKLIPSCKEWTEYIKKAEMALYGEGQRAYEKYRTGFKNAFGRGSMHADEWNLWAEQYLVYQAFAGFCLGPDEKNPAVKVRAAAVMLLLIRELAMAKWLENGQEFGFDSFAGIVSRVEGEMERVSGNYPRMEKICTRQPVFQARQLTRMLMYDT